MFRVTYTCILVSDFHLPTLVIDCCHVSTLTTLKVCHNGANQRFHIPILWLGDVYLNKLRGGGTQHQKDDEIVLEGISSDLCMTVFMSYQRNVNMTTCLEEDSVAHQQEFEFNPETRQIVALGLCLDYNPNNMNVYLHECTGWPNQVGRR